MQSFPTPSIQLSSPGPFTCGMTDAKVSFLLNSMKSAHQPGITNSLLPYWTAGRMCPQAQWGWVRQGWHLCTLISLLGLETLSHCWLVCTFYRWKKAYLFLFRISTLKGIYSQTHLMQCNIALKPIHKLSECLLGWNFTLSKGC